MSSLFSNHIEDKSEHNTLKLWEYCFYCKSSQPFIAKSDQWHYVPFRTVFRSLCMSSKLSWVSSNELRLVLWIYLHSSFPKYKPIMNRRYKFLPNQLRKIEGLNIERLDPDILIFQNELVQWQFSLPISHFCPGRKDPLFAYFSTGMPGDTFLFHSIQTR